MVIAGRPGETTGFRAYGLDRIYAATGYPD
jgi:hypothetical protein